MEMKNNPRLEFAIKSVAGILLTAALLFVSAGTIDWRSAWAYLGVLVLAVVATLLFVDPGLIAERNRRRHANQKAWDKAILGVYGLIEGMLIPLFAGLSVRFEWKPEVGTTVQYIAFLVVLLGWGLHLWAMAVNRYFAQVVRIQDDRGQTVVTEGPYRIIRHPMYAMLIPFMLGIGLTLESWWALVPGGLIGALFVLRTALEDKMLQAELPGYREYAQKVRYRLFPGIW